jgi:hypothetical protein
MAKKNKISSNGRENILKGKVYFSENHHTDMRVKILSQIKNGIDVMVAANKKCFPCSTKRKGLRNESINGKIKHNPSTRR